MLQTVVGNSLTLSKDSAEQQSQQVNGDDLSPESPTSSRSHMSDDTGVSSSSSVNGDKVESAIDNNAENKSVDEEEPKKTDIKKTKVNIILMFIFKKKKIILPT